MDSEGGTERGACYRSRKTVTVSKKKAVDKREDGVRKIEVHTDRPSENSSGNLADVDCVLRRRHIQNTKAKRTRLTHNHVLLPEELAYPRPHSHMAGRLLTEEILSGEPRLEPGDGQLGGEDGFRHELLHADGVVLGVLGEGVVRVELDGALFGDAVCEVVGVEVGLEAADENDESRTRHSP